MRKINKNKNTAAAIVICLSFALCIGVFFAMSTGFGSSEYSDRSIKEVRIGSSAAAVYSERGEFDFYNIFNGVDAMGNRHGTCVFSGTVTDIREYEVEWTDGSGEKWGPFTRTVIEVVADKIYNGQPPSDGNTVRVLFTQSLASLPEDENIIEKGGSYVFLNCWTIDEEYMKIAADSGTGSEKDMSLKMADAVMGGVWNSVFPVENGEVRLYNGFSPLASALDEPNFSAPPDSGDIQGGTEPNTGKPGGNGGTTRPNTDGYFYMDSERFDKNFEKFFKKLNGKNGEANENRN